MTQAELEAAMRELGHVPDGKPGGAPSVRMRCGKCEGIDVPEHHRLCAKRRRSM